MINNSFTNPATAALLGFEVVEIRSNSKGLVDIDSLKSVLGDDTAAIMLTNPNTLGLFEEEIMEVQQEISLSINQAKEGKIVKEWDIYDSSALAELIK